MNVTLKYSEQGETFAVIVDFSALTFAMVTPNSVTAWGLYQHPYEAWQITLKPTQGGTLTIRRTPGAINKALEVIY